MAINQQRQKDVWEKWDWAWNGLFYATVVISFLLMLRNYNQATPVWVLGILTVVLMIWHWVGLKLAFKDQDSWNERSMARFIILIGDIIIWFVLVNNAPAYYIALFGLFIQVFRNLPIKYATIAVLLLSTATVFEQFSGPGELINLSNPTLWIFLAMGFAGILFAHWISVIIEQSTRRRELIEQLEAAQADLAAAERREGVLEERQRLAREIHDTLAQGFTSIVMHLEAAEQAISVDPVRVQKHLNLARSTARSSLDQARRVVQDLRPDLLEQHSLPDAIERTASSWGKETGVVPVVLITGNPVNLHPNIEVTLLRAAQEALNNIRKHAQATSVQITLSYMNDLVILDIQDDGLGMNQTGRPDLSGGYGLQAMRERVGQVGGDLTIESDPEDGTTIVVSIPLSETSFSVDKNFPKLE